MKKRVCNVIALIFGFLAGQQLVKILEGTSYNAINIIVDICYSLGIIMYAVVDALGNKKENRKKQ